MKSILRYSIIAMLISGLSLVFYTPVEVAPKKCSTKKCGKKKVTRTQKGKVTEVKTCQTCSWAMCDTNSEGQLILSGTYSETTCTIDSQSASQTQFPLFQRHIQRKAGSENNKR